MMSNEQGKRAGKVPELVGGIDLRSFPLTPQDAYVLSRIDGKLAADDLSSVTGLPAASVEESLQRLLSWGVTRLRGEEGPASVERNERALGRLTNSRPLSPNAASSSNQSPPLPPAGRPMAAREAAAAERRDGEPSPALYDPSELDEPVDLEISRKRTILDTYYQLEHLDYYELLGVGIDADKKAVKDAYFNAVSVFHPDRYFGKRLGSYKGKLEKVFERITEAHDRLTKKRSRQEYDEYLASKNEVRARAIRLLSEEAHARELEAAKQRIDEAALRPSIPPPDPSSPSPSSWQYAAPPPATPPPSREAGSDAPRSRPLSLPPPMDPEHRRRLLANRLAGRTASAPDAATAQVDPTVPSGMRSQQWAADELRRRRDERVVSARQSEIARQKARAARAREVNDPMTAANALRIAATLAPEDHELARLAQVALEDAYAALAPSYLQQARYEEQEGHFAAAAANYQLAARGAPSGALFERAAHCLLHANGDLRVAADCAKRALELNGERIEFRLTLARVYLAAKKRQSAIAELERATNLAPHHEGARELLKRVLKGEE